MSRIILKLADWLLGGQLDRLANAIGGSGYDSE